MTFHIEKINLNDIDQIEVELNALKDEPINSAVELKNWLIKQTELYDSIDESLMGHYIQFQCFSTDEKVKKAVEHDQQKVQPMLKRYKYLLDLKFIQSPFVSELDSAYYSRLIKFKENAMRLYNEENIELEIEEDRLVTKYFELTGSLTIQWDGEEITINQVRQYFEDSNRDIRKKAMTLMYEAFASIESELQKILSELIQIRDKKAKNSGFANFRDYMFAKYERFDYTPEDCKQLAESVSKYVVPFAGELEQEHKREINVEDYCPWDRRAVPTGQERLKPFEKTEELIDGTTTIFNQMEPEFASLLKNMDEKGSLDLGSRKGKSQGGFCEYLPVSKMSFIFMNAAKSHDDVITLLHEMGHCIHDHLKKGIPLSKYREIPMESAELASMSMEMLTMDYWNVFYENEEDLLRAKRDQFKGVVGLVPYGMLIDQFQHWLYENPHHTIAERKEKFKELHKRFDGGQVNWDSYEKWIEDQWLIVLHIFEVPFYFIEYVIAQLGAVQMLMQYKDNPIQTLENYKKALSLGGTKSLPEVYETAGIRFDFSQDMIQTLMDFTRNELAQLKN
ncbi:M3 family oligoendopeptidase [Alkalihalobacillus sp. AL-G]|uniref:M3 family oligoendopeptidase n=1 Tax=Alkalihalobacillus sp. AL-G TaxID=2926399 RepID=UPI00272AECD6|nr:M3 family oligoendopeptidase [Alkalihalobacillus sp. AL-G]WLD92167.1 M3 family oligoendopeptidase [Alkalihalobacillus sp. AL-G]